MIKKSFLRVIILGILFAGCFELDEVPVVRYDGPPANMTIAEFQQLHELSDTNPATLIEDDVIITGIVTSTDKYSSSYKEIYFQDGTGGVCIRTSNTSYYKKYPVGQRIFVKAKGLYLENYVSGTRTGFYQIGLYGGDGGTQYLSSKAENQHVFRDGVPLKPTDPEFPAPKIITKTSDIVTGIGGDYHTLVKLTNCYFTQANGTTKYFEPSGTSTTISRYIHFNSGTSTDEVQARISSYCTFANDILPEGALNITGLLTMFGTTKEPTHQLIICSINDVEILPPVKILKTYDMNTNPFEAGWTNKQIKGETVWAYSTGSTNSVKIQAPAGNETECWFVSPKFNFAGEKDVALCFSYRILNGTSDNMKVAYSIDGTWHLLDFVHTAGATEAVIKLPDNIATNPNLQIAFQYKTTETYPMWTISKIEFKGNVAM
ncbi:MAG: DUF5689 domain-containing protein [Bacteroidetes bacterium]|nr:DUF5689 domain-containing protein [Bacteroidota bacterium]MCL1968957.1 DUF5689 domain-containing protein [Bacteroidota bacterium]